MVVQDLGQLRVTELVELAQAAEGFIVGGQDHSLQRMQCRAGYEVTSLEIDWLIRMYKHRKV